MKLETMFSDFTQVEALPGGWARLEQKLTAYGNDGVRRALIDTLDRIDPLEQLYLRGAIYEVLGDFDAARSIWRKVALEARRENNVDVLALAEASLERLP